MVKEHFTVSEDERIRIAWQMIDDDANCYPARGGVYYHKGWGYPLGFFKHGEAYRWTAADGSYLEIGQGGHSLYEGSIPMYHEFARYTIGGYPHQHSGRTLSDFPVQSGRPACFWHVPEAEEKCYMEISADPVLKRIRVYDVDSLGVLARSYGGAIGIYVNNITPGEVVVGAYAEKGIAVGTEPIETVYPLQDGISLMAIYGKDAAS